MVDTKELGKLKLEHKISKGIFITGKTYCFYDDKGKFHNKAKGIKSDSLRYMDYLFLLNNRNVNTAIKVSSNKDWRKGSVSISNINVTLNSDSYERRTKILNNQGQWVDTEPFLMDHLTHINY